MFRLVALLVFFFAVAVPRPSENILDPPDLSEQEIIPLALKYRQQLQHTINITPATLNSLDTPTPTWYVLEPQEPEVPLTELLVSDPLYGYMSLQL